ncbi:hypothetical protein BGX33_000347 [Mortierella sp. NVP41]|nr:hypothetical protein BGX33_000347 [Mortierella sp. NVP41]
MSASHHEHALNVPEILHCVGIFMTKKPLATSLLVCRYFHQTLEPLLYMDLRLAYNKDRRPTPTAIQQGHHLHHVRHFTSSDFISVDYLSLDFRNLVSITLKGYIEFLFFGPEDEEDDDDMDPHQVGTDMDILNALETLIRRNNGLRQLAFQHPNPQIGPNVWKAIASSTQSQDQQQQEIGVTPTDLPTTTRTRPRLDLLHVSSATIDKKSMPSFLAACQTTKSLQILRCTVLGLQDRDHPDHHHRLIPPPHMNGSFSPQRVHLGDVMGLSVLAQLEFLARCPDIREIDWQSTTCWGYGDNKFYRVLKRDTGVSRNQPLPTIDDFRRLILPGPGRGGGTWTHLRSFVVSGQYTTDRQGGLLKFIPDEGFAHILESIPAQQLERLECVATAFGPLGLQALKRHCNSLEVLRVERSSDFTSTLVQEAMEWFPKLKSLCVQSLSVKDIVRGGPWVCLGLKEFAVLFDMDGAVGPAAASDDDNDPEDKYKRHRLMFGRISSLVGLEKLVLRDQRGDGREDAAPGLQFRLLYGLGALSTLKQLRNLDVRFTRQKLELSDVHVE